MAKIGACISAVFSWPVLISPGYERIREVSTELGYTAHEAQTFAEWVRSLRIPNHGKHGGHQYKYDKAPEVADFLADFDTEADHVLDRRSGPGVNFATRTFFILASTGGLDPCSKLPRRRFASGSQVLAHGGGVRGL